MKKEKEKQDIHSQIYFIADLPIIDIIPEVNHFNLVFCLQDKSGALSALSESVVGLVKSGDQEAPAAAQKVDMLSKQWQRMQRVTETRIKLSLLYVSFHKLANQVSLHTC